MSTSFARRDRQVRLDFTESCEQTASEVRGPTNSSTQDSSTGRKQDAAYDRVADEYYEHARHPTCAAFRVASLHLLRPALRRLGNLGSVLDVGAGRSVFCDLGEDARYQALTLLDASERMLEHSRAYFGSSVSYVIASAYDSGLNAGSFDTVVASAGDPYNEPAFWSECRRLLKPSGRVLFSTPSLQWASRFREGEHSPVHVAAFVLRDGVRVDTTSFVLSEGQQMAMMEACGLTTHLVDRMTLNDVNKSIKAPKLNVLAPDEALFVLYDGVRRV